MEREGVAEVVQDTLTRVFNKLDATALGLAVGSVTGAALFLATMTLTLSGGHGLIGYLELLNQYFPGYRVSVAGSLLGLFYGLAVGFVAGWGFAFARNAALALYLTISYSRAEKQFLRRWLDYL